MKQKVCGECGEEGRYTCSKCKEEKYCSVACFKLHETHCPAIVKAEAVKEELAKEEDACGSEEAPAKVTPLPSPGLSAASAPPNRVPDLQSRPKRAPGPLTVAQLERLRFDPALRAVVGSPGLRDLLTKIAHAPDPRYLTETALLHDPQFKDFAEKCLEVAKGPELGMREDISDDPLAMFTQLLAGHPDVDADD